MIDGQIHNILSVAGVISEIKELLEEKHGPLKRVSVAAAGRALKTSEGSMTVDISEQSLILNEDVNRLELAAVQQAQQKLLSSDSVTKDDYYYCVGYSVLYYKLEGEEIGSLIDQAGRSASVEVIATFLPRVVVESLLSSLKRSGLEMEALTLEPIAAINVLIPPSMRRLNVALVDIGAGTSDIAITANNTVVAYGMVPLAGDEITEALSNHFLLDFHLAENAKRKISNEEEIVITDILGFEQNVTSSELNNILKPAVQRLAKSISQEIKRLNNGNSPQAVMVVGGGSLTIGLPKEISKCLELPENRVRIQGLEALNGVTLEPNIPSSPELVTPIGIAIAARRAPIHYMSVSVNNKTIRIFELKEMTVGDALLAANITARQLYGTPGLGISIKLNESDILIPGEHGTPSTILLNGNIASTKDIIMNEDAIEVKPGKDGNHASATVQDLLEEAVSILALVGGIQVELKPEIIINGKVRPLDTKVQDQDKINVIHAKTLAAALKKLNRSGLLKEMPFTLSVNQRTITLKGRTTHFSIGSIPISPSYVIKDGDDITIHSQPLPTVDEVVSEIGKRAFDVISVTFNGSLVTIRKPRLSITLNGQPAEGTEVVKKYDCLDFISLSDSPITFGDIFAFTDYSLPENPSSNYQLLRNGSQIRFNEPIFGGDSLDIIFT
ncbi:cell division protein FtsA [Sporosarcina limicola]|uniref:Cell division ATPase FtsA n=1 Tax=Sporosarcina limicola TaxID=34101 RepID=A0A927MJM5_9BACL|nr:cell division FtsA domain-containing protein [Sporosarcina limicola]MBE1554362.1 cell division ATPase FtsA [Sporosarcina limicola]